jgi:hypothetical protein
MKLMISDLRLSNGKKNIEPGNLEGRHPYHHILIPSRL